MEIATIEKKSLWSQTTNFVDLENPVKPGNSIKIKKLKKMGKLWKNQSTKNQLETFKQNAATTHKVLDKTSKHQVQ